MNPEDLLRELRDPDLWQGLRMPRSGRGRPGVARSRVLPAVAALAIAVMAVTVIGVGFASLHRAGEPAATATPTRSPEVISSPMPIPAFSGVTAGPVRSYSAKHRPASCTLKQLQTESKQDGGGAAGTYVLALFVRNAGADCLLSGGIVRVGSDVLSYDYPSTRSSTVLPALTVAKIVLGATEVCHPETGTGTNVVMTKLTQRISLLAGGSERALGTRFPETLCHSPFISSITLDPDDAVFPSPIPGLAVSVDDAIPTRPGPYDYTATLENTGSTAVVLTSCPVATEVVGDVVRLLTLHCVVGATLQPDQRVSLPVTTTVPSRDDEIQVFLSGGSATTAESTTCTLAQLQLTETGSAGANTTNWIQPVRIANSGGVCTLPVTAFSASGRTASAPAGAPATISLPRGTSTVLVQAPLACPDGSTNVDGTPLDKYHEKPLNLELGGAFAPGLDELFPQLHCAGPVAYLVN